MTARAYIAIIPVCRDSTGHHLPCLEFAPDVGVRVGERLLAEDENGEAIWGVVTLGNGGSPVLVLDARPGQNAKWLRIRRPTPPIAEVQP